MDEWLEVSVTTDHEAAESVAEVLSRYAQRGVAIEAAAGGWEAGPVTVRAYLPHDDHTSTHQRCIQAALGHLNQIRPVSAPAFRWVAESDWAEAWKQKLTVMHIGQHIVIRPSWRDYEPVDGDIVIQLDPGMAFGTGLHPTTQLCLTALEQRVSAGMDVLDIGTGSGILAIAAAKLGAGRVAAVDNDPVAVRTARENVIANHMQEIVSVVAGSLADVSGCYDVVVVNILAPVIIEMLAEGLRERLKPAGCLIAAGIIAEQAEDVIAAMAKQQLPLVERRQSDDWVCLVGR
jgi:ribosomal protein L11 methyltransferase